MACPVVPVINVIESLEINEIVFPALVALPVSVPCRESPINSRFVCHFSLPEHQSISIVITTPHRSRTIGSARACPSAISHQGRSVRSSDTAPPVPVTLFAAKLKLMLANPVFGKFVGMPIRGVIGTGAAGGLPSLVRVH